MRALYPVVMIGLALMLSACATSTSPAQSAAKASQDTQAPVAPPKCHHNSQ